MKKLLLLLVLLVLTSCNNAKIWRGDYASSDGQNIITIKEYSEFEFESPEDKTVVFTGKIEIRGTEMKFVSQEAGTYTFKIDNEQQFTFLNSYAPIEMWEVNTVFKRK